MATDTPADLSEILQPVLEQSELPSIAAAVVKGNELVARGAVGVRSSENSTEVTIDDKYHLGSCTKPFTATLAAILIEDGLLNWDTTIAEVLEGKLEGKLDDIHADYRQVTVEQMLAHVGGFPTAAPAIAWTQAWDDQGQLKPPAQRLAFASSILHEPPAYPPNSKSEYSNQGYAVVGVMLETLAGKAWEKLIEERIFKPLQMNNAGFRAPGKAGSLDQPLGHRSNQPVTPGKHADNPDAIGPAGTFHTSITDWTKFTRFHLLRQPGTLLKEAASFDKLHATLPSSGNYSIGGWLIHDQQRFGGHCLQMTGSNKMWYSLMWIFPGFDLSIVVTGNAAPESAFSSLDSVVAELIKLYR